MTFLSEADHALDTLLPGLSDRLRDYPMTTLERPGGPGVKLFREAGGCGLVIPAALGGVGADIRSAMRVQRALGAISPSLAIATTMHHFSVATLVAMSETADSREGFLLTAIAEQRQLLASGFAEGRAGQGVLAPTMRARRLGDGYVLSGSKKPCSLAHSMDLLTASVCLTGDEGGDQVGVAIVPAGAPGVSVEPFWNSDVLAGAESDAVLLDDVFIEAELVVALPGGAADRIQATGLVWFQLLMSAGYLGAASALARRLLDRGPRDRGVEAIIDLEAAYAGLESIGIRLMQGEPANELLTKALMCRYASQDAINRSVSGIVEQLGGMAFIRDPSVGYLSAVTRALGFHPPSRAATLSSIGAALTGKELEIS
ncbi:acyl-CoA dehydrogenase family protein [Jidongwangia harbinensis]|uniref:acyl-CoA dehydrogenase family protein n=1 Tax=Jidongwangia harbinensis TaxID=2878561 RepID=UPI001CDA3F3A|nr:acyl-CoA dehydrogenase family protein [Jidongwangia harbinensis]MCA2212155.1 acyl-CoA/acyl-ACP dehydrogenase [Jidongwangia harbinensis]